MLRALHRYRTLDPAVCFCVEFLLINSVVLLTASLQSPVSNLVWRHAVPYIPGALLITLTCQICMYYADLYNLKTVLCPQSLCMKLLQSIAAAAIVLAVIFHFVPSYLLITETCL